METANALKAATKLIETEVYELIEINNRSAASNQEMADYASRTGDDYDPVEFDRIMERRFASIERGNELAKIIVDRLGGEYD